MISPHTTPIETMSPTTDAIHQTMIAVAVVGGCLSGGAWFWFSLTTAGSVSLGVGAAVLNLFLLERVVVGLLTGSGSAWGVGFLKLLILLGGSWGLFLTGLAEVLPFAAGFGALPIGVTLSPFFLKTSILANSTSSTSPEARGA